MLHGLQSAAARFGVLCGASRLLAALSADLEPFNLRLAVRVPSLPWGGRALDERIVHWEQTRVQRRLQSLAGEDTTERVRSLNQLLNAAGSLRCLDPKGATEILASASSRARHALHRPLDFACQADREAVGHSMIAAIRLRSCADAYSAPTHRPAVDPRTLG
jgi:hypothetical protein